MARDWLEVVQGDAQGQRLDVEVELAVGRAAEQAGNLGGDPELSRTHARFRRTASGEIIVEDLGSTNGTAVNGKRIDGLYVLKVGDRVALGGSVLEVRGDSSGATMVRGTPEAPAPRPTTVRTSPPPAAAVPPHRAPGPGAGPGPGPADPARPQLGALPNLGASEPPPRRLDPRVPILGVLLLLVVAGLVVALATRTSKSTASAATEGAFDGTAYVLSNRTAPKGNSVIAYRYLGASLSPLRLREYPTGGSGSVDMGGVSSSLDGDQQVWTNADHTLLFAVNQGSDSIAVFHIAADGGLTPVKGSPFPSGGVAPISVGVSGDTLLVVNKALDGVRNLKGRPPTITQLKVHGDGSLSPVGTPVSTAPGAIPTQAWISPDGKLGVVSEFSKSDYLTFVRGSDGTFQPGPPAPISNAQRRFGIKPKPPKPPPGAAPPPPSGPPPLGAQGLVGHPKQPLLYSNISLFSELAVYSYDATGRLSFVKGVPIKDGFLACWTDITPDGRFLYIGITNGNKVAAFDLADPRNPRLIQSMVMRGMGNTLNTHVDPTGKELFVISSRVVGVPPGSGNELHVLRIGSDGRLTETGTSPAPVPVTTSTMPYGLVVVRHR
jgi:6-phosphogluconolactonase (cycloisomerase 2 family)